MQRGTENKVATAKHTCIRKMFLCITKKRDFFLNYKNLMIEKKSRRAKKRRKS